MTNEELLVKRYKMIADYPQGIPLHQVGDVFIKRGIHFTNGQRGMLDTEIAKYPHLFRRLEWWEERTVEDMPEYVRVTGYSYNHFKVTTGVYKVLEGGVSAYGREDMLTVEGISYKDNPEPIYIENCEPATLEEYEAYQKSQSNETNPA